MRALAALLPLLLAAQAPVPGTVSVEPATGDVSGATAQIFAEAVQGALTDVQFLPIRPPGQGRYTARLRVSREARGQVASSEPRWDSSGGLGSWGAALSVRLPSRKPQMRMLYATRLDIAIVPRGGGQPVWTGKALTVQVEATRNDSPAALAAKLARGVMGRFPAQSDEVAAIP
ncbi:hypothetical protein SAMN06297144_2636 [Sphingomonas guangdongensis]|uniref:DUF4136 domain-containing protein n=1 Tax=Sphingomonas guangdongensis TaxID=1141890 RepID=A0A285R0Z0_9SPHN|nr:hypothetical protein [Sphingomonas guangdongensis]SOB87504.1 hypothetical protein SAMN06297144_2636 [Sphingomonas guangdongensis]